LQGAAIANFGWAVAAGIGVILSAVYMLWMYQRAFFGRLSDEVAHHFADLSPREWAALVPMLVLMVWMGVYAQSFLPPIAASNAATLEQSKRRVSFTVQTLPPAPVKENALVR
jgi:NADH-quinone oxidoreductase subunit M